MIDWEAVKKEFNSLLDKNGNLSSRNFKKNLLDFIEKYPIFKGMSGNQIKFHIQSKNLNWPVCPHCDKKVKIDKRGNYKSTCEDHKFINRKCWNKGLTKEESESLKQISEKQKIIKKNKAPSKRCIDAAAKINKGKKHSEERKEKVKNTCLKRYGKTSYLSLVQYKGLEAQREIYGDKLFAGSEKRKRMNDQIVSTMKQTNLKRYGVEHVCQNKEINNKRVESLVNNGNMFFGSEKHLNQLENFLEKRKVTCLEKYGVENPSQDNNIQQKRISTLNNNNTWFFHSLEYNKRFEEFLDKKTQTSLNNWGTEHPMQSEIVKDRLKNTNLSHWGVEHYFQSTYYREVVFPSIVHDLVKKINETKRKNESFNTSRSEKDSLEKLKQKFKYVFGQYSDKRYPYKCDAYVPELDLFIEFNYHWTHGSQPYIESDYNQKQLEKWEEKSKTSKFYKLAIETWTGADIIKRTVGQELNWIEFFDEQNFDEWLSSFPDKSFTFQDININKWENKPSKNDFEKFLISKNSYKMSTTNRYKNLLIPFIFNIFYKKEISLLENNKIKRKLLQNRYQYLNKTNISQKELFDGFSKAGIHKGFSTFSPLVIKSFIRDFNIESIYDPFGGWGSRMLGAWDIEYHYNDANKELLDRIKEMHQYYNQFKESKKKTFSSEDAAKYFPNKKFDALFTCPPYFKTEDYDFTLDSTKLFPKYEKWLSIWWRNVVKQSVGKVKYFVYVISDKYADDMNDIILKEGYMLIDTKQVSSVKQNHFSKSVNEKLFIFKHDELL